jgi:hypothetical protein
MYSPDIYSFLKALEIWIFRRTSSFLNTKYSGRFSCVSRGRLEGQPDGVAPTNALNHQHLELEMAISGAEL